MKDTFCSVLVAVAALALFTFVEPVQAQNAPSSAVLVIHGGAGSISPDNMPPERETEYREKLEEALRAGYTVINEGGASLDAVIAAISVMEDSPLFNSGRGAVVTSAGTVELDASIMDGNTGNAGAVASIKTVKSPIRLARAVMDQSPHVLLVGDGAEAFAEEVGMERVPNE